MTDRNGITHLCCLVLLAIVATASSLHAAAPVDNAAAALIAQGDEKRSAGDYKAALDLYRQARKIGGDQPTLLLSIAVTAYNAKEFAAGSEALDAYLKALPEKAKDARVAELRQAPEKGAAPPAAKSTAPIRVTPELRLAIRTVARQTQDLLKEQSAGHAAEVQLLAIAVRQRLGEMIGKGAGDDAELWRAAGIFAVASADRELAAWATEAVLRLAGDDWEKDPQLADLLPRLNSLAPEARVRWIKTERQYVLSIGSEKRPDDARARGFVQEALVIFGVNSLGMKFVRIEPGQFWMGSPQNEEGRFDDETQHHVKLTKPFFMATTTVTQKQWTDVMATVLNPKQATLAGVGDDYPMYDVSWQEAVDFCKKLGSRDGHHYRLPTEAEWEYACRAGTSSAYGGTGRLDEMGWFADNSGDARIDSANIWTTDVAHYGDRLRANHCATHPVGKKRPNAWGLFDMHGNVGQWCQDAYKADVTGETLNPMVEGDGTAPRVLRGGSWRDGPLFCRSAFRYRFAPGFRFNLIGFRICLDFD